MAVPVSDEYSVDRPEISGGRVPTSIKWRVSACVHVHRLIARSHPSSIIISYTRRTAQVYPFIMVSVSKVRSARDASAIKPRSAARHRIGRAHTLVRDRPATIRLGVLRAAHERHGAPARVAQQAGSPALPEGAGTPDLRVNARTGHGDQTRCQGVGAATCRHLSTQSTHARCSLPERRAGSTQADAYS